MLGAIPWGAVIELAAMLILIGISWGTNRQAVNGLGRRVTDNTRDLAELRALLATQAEQAQSLANIDRRLQRIEALLDTRIHLGE